MNSSSDTLDIAPLRQQQPVNTPPIGPANDPAAVRSARAKIAAIEAAEARVMAAPATMPPDGLITNPKVLAQDPKTFTGTAAPLPPVFEAVRTKAKHHGVPSALKPVLTSVGVFLLLVLLLKSPVIYNEVKYSLTNTPDNTVVASVTAPGAIIPAEPSISIPKINVYSPVVYEPSVAEANVQKALEGGVVHYGNTPVPGTGGNSVIFGHSSNDWWEPGNYKFIFGLLDKLSPGDQFTVDYNSVRYTYEVTGSRVVAPTEVSVLNQTVEPTMTLITCTPPGTALKRLVISAKQISPAPATSVAVEATPQPDVSYDLPGAPTGPIQKITDAVGGILNGIGGIFGIGDEETVPSVTTSPAAGAALPGN